MTLLLNKSTIETVLDMSTTIDVMADAFTELGNGFCETPQRLAMADLTRKGWAAFMPARLSMKGAFGVKVVSTYDDNPSTYGLPTTMGTILYIDNNTGEVLSVMDGTFITAMRTGAASGLATRYLASENVSVAGVIGTGVQARTQLAAVCSVRSIDSVICFSSGNKERQISFINDMSGQLGVDVRLARSTREVVENADVLVLATSSGQPVIDGDWLRLGTHVNAIGSHTPDRRELDAKSIMKSKVVCDYIPSCLVEAGDIIIPINEGTFTNSVIHADLGELVTGLKKARETEDEITLFKSVGLSIQDVAVAKYVYDKAVLQNLGVNFDFS